MYKNPMFTCETPTAKCEACLSKLFGEDHIMCINLFVSPILKKNVLKVIIS